ncbi:MAG: succinate dehydrogenase, hydrophobic membrane anchor protein [Pseudomonadota bacterium]|nr:succinate dehydrogenase, hydrophobic membrane anchor protein [Pseudomonadota bacterium]
MSLQSPLGRVRGLGSAKDGTHHWWMQRVTAVALVPLALWFAVAIIKMTGASHGEAIAWVQSPFNAIMLLLLIVATFHHMQLGLQVVIEDYVHREGTKVVLILTEKLASFTLAVAAGFAVLKIAFGG